MKLRSLFAFTLWSMVSLLAWSETLRSNRGEIFVGHVSGIYGDTVLIGNDKGSAAVPLDKLDDASIGVVADFLAVKSAPVTWATSDSIAAKAVAKKLQLLRNNKLVAFEPGARPEPEFYLVYFGAFWCPPCRRFSPQLVEAYQRMKQTSPDRFEVIFVSDDTSAGEQLNYAREVNMPFPILKYSAAGKVPAFDRWRGSGIPCLIVLNRAGHLLFHSYAGKEYLGAYDPLEKFEALLKSLEQTTAAPRPARHRLAIAQHLRTAGSTDSPPQAYLVNLDPRRHRTLQGKALQVSATVDTHGRAQDVEFQPQLDAVTEESLRRAAEDWLFLPAVKNGRPTEARIEFPLEIKAS